MKNAITIIIFLYSSLTLIGQNPDTGYPENYKPKSINDALNYMEYSLPEKDKIEFKNKTEFNAVVDAHMGYGMFIRNSWLRHGNPKLLKFFYKNKVFPMDDMSSIILKLFHRKLNIKNYSSKPLLKPYHIKWKEGKEGRRKYNDSIDSVLKSFKVNDTITFKYYYSVIGNEPDEMKLYETCQPKAIVLKRNVRKRKLFVKLISACKKDGISTNNERDKGKELIELGKTGWTNYYVWYQ
ncbi:DUF6794 domain-containing protein [Flavobacterium chuncheonense]|uniref:DUF6794 domain-containing protein n=1 Tax=Flavobacterium chuncheonense TaxID=2026653 RepID=A0ABW5YP38_9FLAO